MPHILVGNTTLSLTASTIIGQTLQVLGVVCKGSGGMLGMHICSRVWHSHFWIKHRDFARSREHWISKMLAY
jgi:hypothetical protein